MDAVEELDEAEVSTPAPRRGNGGRGPAPKEEVSHSAQAMTQADDRTVYEFLRDIGTGGSINLKLSRSSPRTLTDGTLCSGSLAEYDEPFEEEDIRRLYGGGKYQIKAYRRGAKGGLQYAGARTFEIAGVPKMPGVETPMATMVQPSRDDADIPLQRQAMGMMERMAVDSQRRADRIESEARNGNGRSSAEEIRLAMAPLEAQLKALNDQILNQQRIISDKDAKILELVTRKPETTFQDKMLDKMIDGENARITHLREEHASELRQMRQSHTDEIRIMREQHRDELAQRDRSHEREISHMERSNTGSSDSARLGWEARIDTFKTRVSSLETDLAAAKAEVQALREKKEKGPVEMMEEMATLKNTMEALGIGGASGEAEPSTWERILSGVLESPLAKAVSTRIEQAPAAPPPPPPQQQRVVVKRKPQPNPAMTAATPENPAQHAQTQQAATVTAPVPKKKPEPPKLSQVDVSLAVSFMENAVTGGQPPEAFAESARSMVPQNILEYIRMVGIDEFLKLAQIPDGTPLASQNGRNYMRKVAKALIGEA